MSQLQLNPPQLELSTSRTHQQKQGFFYTRQTLTKSSMPEKHLFVNSSHYQDRPDPKLRQKIASHAAKYGPNGALAFKTSPDSESITSSASQPSVGRHAPKQLHSDPRTPMQRSASISSSPGDARLRKDYEIMLARFDDFCACTDDGSKKTKAAGNAVHSEECSLLDDYLELCAQHELPFRVFTYEQQTNCQLFGAPTEDALILQCLLVAGQAAIDGLDPKFRGRASKSTLTLQQKALSLMQKLIAKRPNVVDDSLVLASAILLVTAAYFDDSDAYKAHKSSLQRLIDAQGGMNQTKAHRTVKMMCNNAEICLSLYRYSTNKPQSLTSKKDTGAPQFPSQAPLKLKYPMPPLAPELAKAIERMSSGFQALAKSSKLSVQALSLVGIVTKWSMLIDQSTNSEAEQKQLLGGSAGSNARLLDLYTDAVESQRLAAFVLLSLPVDSMHMKLEKCLCLGILNLLHSTTLMQCPTPVRERLTIDFAETTIAFSPKTKDEEDCIIWLALAVAAEWKHCASKLASSPILERHDHDTATQCQTWLQRSTQMMDWIIVKYERARTWEDIATICARFLWLRRLNGEWKQTWKEAMERRLRNMPRKKSRSSP